MSSIKGETDTRPVEPTVEWTVQWTRLYGPCKNNPECGSHPDYSRDDFGMPRMTARDLGIMTRGRASSPCLFYEEFMDYRERYAKKYGEVDVHAQPNRHTVKFKRNYAKIGLVLGPKKTTSTTTSTTMSTTTTDTAGAATTASSARRTTTTGAQRKSPPG